jgi:hypothetical protein
LNFVVDGGKTWSGVLSSDFSGATVTAAAVFVPSATTGAGASGVPAVSAAALPSVVDCGFGVFAVDAGGFGAAGDGEGEFFSTGGFGAAGDGEGACFSAGGFVVFALGAGGGAGGFLETVEVAIVVSLLMSRNFLEEVRSVETNGIRHLSFTVRSRRIW